MLIVFSDPHIYPRRARSTRKLDQIIFYYLVYIIHCWCLKIGSTQQQNMLSSRLSSSVGWRSDARFNCIKACTLPCWISASGQVKFSLPNDKIQPISKSAGLNFVETSNKFRAGIVKGTAGDNQEELFDDDDDLCPVECVREFKTDEEFLKILEKSKETNSLVVVDFYRTSCGSCKYIEQGFSKLCKGSGSQDAPVIFLKHNVIDEYDEESEVAERLRIRAVPLFHFYKNGVLLEAFPTRDKARIDAAILKYTTYNTLDTAR